MIKSFSGLVLGRYVCQGSGVAGGAEPALPAGVFFAWGFGGIWLRYLRGGGGVAMWQEKIVAAEGKIFQCLLVNLQVCCRGWL